MNYLTYDDKGIPVAKLNIDGIPKKIISLVESSYDVICCKRCKGKKCTGKCCKKCSYKIEYVSDEDNEELDLDLLDDAFFKKMQFPNRFNVTKFREAIIHKQVEDGLYNQVKKYIKEREKKEIIIYDGDIQPIPNINTRECIYVAGPSGSGKSTYVSKYAMEYRKLFPKNEIYVFSRVSNDECIDKLNPKRIAIDNELVKNPISPDELSNSLVIFDDTDTIPDKKTRDSITSLKNDLLETGRHEDVYVCITSHLINNYKETRTVLNESHSITVFPSSGSSYSIKYILKNYGGMDTASIQKALSLPSRWITLKKSYPQAILYSKGIYLLH